MTSVPFLSPTFPPLEELAADYEAICRSGIFTNGGPKERGFAEALEDWVGHGVRFSLTSSATTALQLACAECFGRPGGLVLLPSFTFAAGALALQWSGFAPFFIDIEGGSWQPRIADAATILASSRDEVAGVLLCSTFGVANDEVAAWEQLCEHHGVPLVIDSAAGLGSEYASGERLGARGDCEVFSFHATKTLAVGEGGGIATRSPELHARLTRARNFGFDDARTVVALGTNAKMSELTAAIGLRQLGRLTARLNARRCALDRYRMMLEPRGYDFQPNAGRSAVPFVSVLAPTRAARDSFSRALTRNGVEHRDYYNPPLHQHPFFTSHRRSGRLDNTLDVAARVLSLPMFDGMDEAAFRRIGSALATAGAA
jgi:dTDP-4-amino-4,6-dideoxygalactose transaminase